LSDRLLRYINTTQHVEELPLRVREHGGEKISEVIRHGVRQIEDNPKAIERTKVKRHPIAIDLAK
jgi:hypothetical protein